MDLLPLSEEMNVAKALERLCDDEMLLIELLKSLALECREAEKEITMHADQQHFAELQAIAHYYRGIAANLELIHFHASTIALEENAQLGNIEECRQTVATLLACSRRIETLVFNLRDH